VTFVILLVYRKNSCIDLDLIDLDSTILAQTEIKELSIESNVLHIF